MEAPPRLRLALACAELKLPGDGGAVPVAPEAQTVTDTMITIASDSVELEDAIMSGSATVTFKVTTAGGTATYEAEVQS